MAFYMKMGSKSLKASGINFNGSPLKVNCPDGTPPPCSQPSQEAADKDAEKNLLNAGEKKGNTVRTEERIPGGKKITFKTNYSKKADGKSSGSQSKDWEGDLRKMGFTGTVKEMNQAYNATRNSNRTETTTRTILDPIELDPYGIKPPPWKFELASATVTPKYAPVKMPEVEKKTGLVGGSTTFKRKKNKKGDEQSLWQLKLKDALDFSKGDCPSGGCP